MRRYKLKHIMLNEILISFPEHSVSGNDCPLITLYLKNSFRFFVMAGIAWQPIWSDAVENHPITTQKSPLRGGGGGI